MSNDSGRYVEPLCLLQSIKKEKSKWKYSWCNLGEKHIWVQIIIQDFFFFKEYLDWLNF